MIASGMWCLMLTKPFQKCAAFVERSEGDD
jgi:hypothetical protein